MALKNSAKFGPKLNPAFQISHKKICQFVSSRRIGSKFQILLLSFVWKVSDTEGLWNVWAKTECCFPNQPPQNWLISLQHANSVQISNFIGLFCLKGKLPEAKTFTGVLFCDTEVSWNVWAKTWSSFPNQPTKNWSICFKLPKRLQIP